MSNPITAIIACLRRFAARREGNTAIIFGLAAIPLVVAAGMAVDVTRAYTVKMRLSSALDAASLAVGSQGTGLTNAQMQDRLQSFFFANYPSSALGRNVQVNPVPGAGQQASDVNLSQPVVTYQAQATVDMTFMQLIGIPSITVTANGQTHRGFGLEVAIALDNTGSMLCGPHSGAPNYSDTSCAQSTVSSDTNCQQSSGTSPANQTRICVLQTAATNFVNTLHSAMTASDQLYVSVVPYVTTVNVGTDFCSGATTCSNIVTDSCSGDFTDYKGNLIYDAGANPVASSPATTTVTLTGASVTSSSTTVTGLSPNTNNLWIGMSVSGTGIASNTTLSSITSTTAIKLSRNATSTGTNRTLTFTWTGFAANTTANSAVVTMTTNGPNTTGLAAGMVVTGTGIPSNTAIKSVDSATQITLCNKATVTSAANAPAALSFFTPVTYDTTHSATTANWMGCVVEPTSSDENKGVAGVINSSTSDPDYTEPTSWPAWYAYWWVRGGGGINNWTPAGITSQDHTTEKIGKVTSDFDQFPGPNEGCPQPILPLADMSTTANLNKVLLELGNIAGGSADSTSIWPRDAGGTQVHIGAIWAWRVLSPNGPFTPTATGHPLSYTDASSRAWKKVMVLMTDGLEEWPSSSQLTGLGYLSDGKIGTTTSTTTATTNLDARLQSVCANMAAKGILIYTIGLGKDGNEGANNATLQSCPANGGFFVAADPTTLNAAFAQIASSLLTLRLSQ